MSRQHEHTTHPRAAHYFPVFSSVTRAYNIFKSEFLLAAPYMYARARGDDGREFRAPAGIPGRRRGPAAALVIARRSHARARRPRAAHDHDPAGYGFWHGFWPAEKCIRL